MNNSPAGVHLSKHVRVTRIDPPILYVVDNHDFVYSSVKQCAHRFLKHVERVHCTMTQVAHL